MEIIKEKEAWETEVGGSLKVIAGIVECKGTRQMIVLLGSRERMHQVEMRSRTNRTSVICVGRKDISARIVQKEGTTIWLARQDYL
jgi:hypothetical protein